MTASKTDVWRELVHLLSVSPTAHLNTVAQLLVCVIDDDRLDNRSLIDAIRKTERELGAIFEREQKSRA